MKTRIANLKQYLLGDLNLKETEEIDLQIITDESLVEELDWAESELIEDYLDETLSPAEIKLFENNFLVSPERETQFKQISLIRDYARCLETKELPNKTSESSPESFFERLKRVLLVNWRPSMAVFALLIVGLSVGVAVFLTTNKTTPLEKEYAELNQKDLSNTAEFNNIVSLNLIPGTFRGTSGFSKLSEDSLTDNILLRLALPTNLNSPQDFKVQLIKDQKVIFTQNKIRFYSNQNGQEVRLLMPSLILKKGEYQIKIEKEPVSDSPYIYNFAVQ